MKMVTAVSVALCLLWSLAPYLVQGSTLLYNEVKLKRYAEVTQHLRTSLDQLTTEYQTRINTINSDVTTTLNDIAADKMAAIGMLSTAVDQMSDIHLTMNKIITPLVLAHCTETYVDKTKHLYGVTALDHGMGYDSQAGQLTIAKSGVYMFEYKGQSSDYGYFSSRTDINGPSAYTISTYHDWEISPFYEMLYLQAGSTVSMASFQDANSWGSPSKVTPGVATQFNLYYLGKFV